ncbi:T9SS type A sorting domain-containing protein [Parabacteroides sp. FAFU027]|uniref:T9SS type A sorting domain-containing protein n=1 Tax=Parabacteroides sp. FAFU027 TaxID=2922715 RepID=UPI001FB01424|nr:T9SS type A sorting domain-containing protein [Parabacteroides sp. FAFU027]
MRTSVILFVLLLAGFMQLFSQHVVVATLKVDYNSYVFEGGNLSEYNCKDCDNTTLPFVTDFHSPGDFGSITFLLKPTSDTIFYATIIWMGTGQIYYPKNFTTDFPYLSPGLSQRVIPMPVNVTWYDMDGKVTVDSSFIKKAIPAWHAIDTLLITRAFSNHPYQAAIYLYPPSVGVFNPDVAKWIVFLYLSGKGLVTNEEINEEKIGIFPNPTSEYLVVSGFAGRFVKYALVDVSGRVIQSGRLSGNTISMSGLSSGMYLLRLFDSKEFALEPIKVFKR